MIEEDFDPVEYLKQIKRSENLRIRQMVNSGEFTDYLLWLNDKMLHEFPEMVIDVIVDEDEQERGK